MLSDNINVEITVSFVFDNLIAEEDLQEVYSGDLKKCVIDMIKDAGICGVIDNDVTVVNVKKL